MRFAFGLLLLSTLPAFGAPVPKELRAGDAQRIAGVWTLTTAKYGQEDYESAHGTKWTLGADGKAIRDRPNEGIGKATFKLDPKAGVKTFDWITEEGNTFVGVYELDGDRFKVILVVNTRERPTVCRPTEGGYCFEFQRGK